MRTTYLAGPMSGFPQHNFPAFDAARDAMQARGWNVISPADLDRECGFDPNTSLVDDQFKRAAIKRDIDALFACDAIAMLPGWEGSKGARVEHALAVYLGLEILNASTGKKL